MATKERLLALLEENRGAYLSGEELAGALGVSRAAVWKAINALRQAGYPIAAATNRGYCMDEAADVLDEQGVRRHAGADCQDLPITVLPVTVSTHAALRELAGGGAQAPCVLLAGEQTGGRGRRGRTFFSPPDTGVYMSLLFRPRHCAVQQATLLTALAAVAMCEAIEEVFGEPAQIKWVNDVFVHGKKVCGILSEASLSMESGEVESVVLSAGVNVYPPHGGFPPELADAAGAIAQEAQPDGRNRLAAAFLRRVLDAAGQGNWSACVEAYRRRSLALGHTVTVLQGDSAHSALVCGIDDMCRLQVRYDDGETASLSYGEIRIRLDE